RSSWARAVVASAIFAILSAWSFTWSFTRIFMVPGVSSPRHSMGGLRRGAAWPRSSNRLPFDGSDQQLYGMDDRDVQAAPTSALSDLPETAGIPRRHDRGPRLRDPRDLAPQELARHPGPAGPVPPP